jgi:hypothetical protein
MIQDLIQDYLGRLAHELDYDRSLSRRVRQEVEDHLWEAVAADPTGNTSESQRRVIARFGDARAIAAEFAVLSLARHSRRAALVAVLVIAGVFIAMKARVAWYVVMPSAIDDDIRAVSALVVLIDRYAFLSSVIIGFGGWIYIQTRNIPAAFDPVYRNELRRFFLTCRTAAAALIVSVASDAVLTALRLRGMAFSATSLVPIVSMAIEIVCVGILVFQIRRVVLRAMSTAALMKS